MPQDQSIVKAMIQLRRLAALHSFTIKRWKCNRRQIDQLEREIGCIIDIDIGYTMILGIVMQPVAIDLNEALTNLQPQYPGIELMPAKLKAGTVLSINMPE